MATPPKVQPIEERSPLDRVAIALLDFMRDVRNVLDRKLTLRENMLGEVRVMRVTGGQVPIGITSTPRLATPPLAVTVLRAVDVATPSTNIDTQPWVDWDFSNGVVTVRRIGALTTGRVYDLTLWIVGG